MFTNYPLMDSNTTTPCATPQIDIRHFKITVICLICGGIVFTILTLFKNLQSMFAVNFLLTNLSIILISVGAAYFFQCGEMKYLLISVSSAVLITIIIVMIGMNLRQLKREGCFLLISISIMLVVWGIIVFYIGLAKNSILFMEFATSACWTCAAAILEFVTACEIKRCRDGDSSLFTYEQIAFILWADILAICISIGMLFLDKLALCD
ncbi:unnamed protein product [Trichobilharzia szidati]|nr:unnamed protein product [Trichobilharzia szidati]